MLFQHDFNIFDFFTQEIVRTVPETETYRRKAALTAVRRIEPTRVRQETEEDPSSLEPGSLSLLPTGHSDDEEVDAEARLLSTHVLTQLQPVPLAEVTITIPETTVPPPTGVLTVSPRIITPEEQALINATAGTLAPPTLRTATGIRLIDLVHAGTTTHGDRVVDPVITKRLAEAVSV